MIFKIENYLALREAAEQFTAFLIEKKVDKERAFDCKLIVYELIGNVLKHSGGNATLYGEVEDGLICLKIGAERPFCPPNTAVCKNRGGKALLPTEYSGVRGRIVRERKRVILGAKAV